MLVYLYIRIDFCHKSKEQRLKCTKNAYNVLKILTIIVILQNYFRKLSFLKKSLLEVYKKKNKFNVTNYFLLWQQWKTCQELQHVGKGGEGWKFI
jgi:hypothetical protein